MSFSVEQALEWNGVLPNLRVQEFTPEGHATKQFGIVADYGWAERILFTDAYEQDAYAICEVLAGSPPSYAAKRPGHGTREMSERSHMARDNGAPFDPTAADTLDAIRLALAGAANEATALEVIHQLLAWCPIVNPERTEATRLLVSAIQSLEGKFTVAGA